MGYLNKVANNFSNVNFSVLNKEPRMRVKKPQVEARIVAEPTEVKENDRFEK